MYKLAQCVTKHNVREPMNCHLAFLMRLSNCHVGVMQNQRDFGGASYTRIYVRLLGPS